MDQRNENNDYISENLGLGTSHIDRADTLNSQANCAFFDNSETLHSQSCDHVYQDGPFDTKEGIDIKDKNVAKRARAPSLVSAYNQQYQQKR